jgi:diguanylate cyclase (GGDEF)-like protein
VTTDISILSDEERRLVELAERGLSVDDMALELGVTRWTVKFRQRKIKEKLDAMSVAESVKSALSNGTALPMKKWSEQETGAGRISVGIIGAGRGGAALIDMLKDDHIIRIGWVLDKNPSAPGLKMADRLGIPVLGDVSAMAGHFVNVVINVTGAPGDDDVIRRSLPPGAEFMGGVSAKLLWKLVDERRKRLDEKERVLKEREIFYHLGLLMEKIDNMKDAGYAVVDYATRLANAAAGAICIFNEDKEFLRLLSSKGFSSEMGQEDGWFINECSISSEIFHKNLSTPLVVRDVGAEKKPNILFVREGIKSLMAAPLTVENKVIGIIFVAERRDRQFGADDVSVFSLLGIYAALTIEKVRVMEGIRHMSITDGLTGLYNQRYLMEQLEREVQRAARHEHPLSIIMLDIDHFKSYNDTFGHLEGNKLLKEVSRILADNTRHTDIVARFGGEEFCLLLHEVEKQGAARFAQRLIEKIAIHPMPNRQITVSGGVAAFPVDGETHTEVLRKADMCLYDAKHGGRNRICS